MPQNVRLRREQIYEEDENSPEGRTVYRQRLPTTRLP